MQKTNLQLRLKILRSISYSSPVKCSLFHWDPISIYKRCRVYEEKFHEFIANSCTCQMVPFLRWQYCIEPIDLNNKQVSNHFWGYWVQHGLYQRIWGKIRLHMTNKNQLIQTMMPILQKKDICHLCKQEHIEIVVIGKSVDKTNAHPVEVNGGQVVIVYPPSNHGCLTLQSNKWINPTKITQNLDRWNCLTITSKSDND